MSEPIRLAALLSDIARRPVVHLTCRWNWKSALVSAVCRAAVFAAANAPSGHTAALRAALVELGFRTVMSGVLGGLTETLSVAAPRWPALVLLPAFGHASEYAVHF